MKKGLGADHARWRWYIWREFPRCARCQDERPKAIACRWWVIYRFRPEENQVSDNGLGSMVVNGQQQPIFQAHGHNGGFGTTGRSIHLNARAGEVLHWAPICAVLNSP